MSLYRRTEKGVWHYRFVIDGQERRGSTRTRNRRVAENVEKAVRDEIASGRFGLAERKRVTFRKAGESWRASKSSRAERTRRDYGELLGQLYKQFGSKLVTVISANDISGLQRARGKQGVGPRRINYEVSIARQVLKSVGEWDRLRNLVTWLPEPTDKGAAVDPHQERLLLDAASKSGSLVLYVLIIVSLDTGLRRAELRRLRRQDLQVSWEDGVITSGGLVVRKSKTKAGEGRYVPFTSRAMGALSLWLSRPELAGARPEHFVFPRHKAIGAGRRPRIECVQLDQPIGDWKTAWNRVRKVADVQVRWHDLRHTFITRLAENPQVSEETIRSLAGHVSKEMLSRYSHIRNRAKQDAIDALDRAGGKGSAQNPAHDAVGGGNRESQNLVTPRFH